ncbi:MAG TPA: NTP transferase domain-containing protein [Steroidobacteraceae bacterium]
MSRAELYGLVLAGGRSTRMKRDKAALGYGGRPQLARAMEILRPQVAGAFVSVRAEQQHDPQRAAYDTIADLQPGLGPLAGIQAALRAHPDKAWLVLACDLPFLEAGTLRHLIERRAPARLATAFRSRFDGLPEPLCAIYEPASRASIEDWIAQGQRCPRAWAAHSDVELLDLPEPRALDNVNTVDEYAAASAAVRTTVGAAVAAPASGRQITVRYFALLREQAGRGSEALQTQARTPHELYAQLQRERGLKLAPQFLRVAVNDEFGDWQQPLADGDTVAFLPPVAGG